MGITTDLIQQFNRTFVSQKAEKDFFRKQKTEYKNALYNKFYKKFVENGDNNPDSVYSYWIQPNVRIETINKNFEYLDISLRIELYDSILNKVYKQFKTNYKMNIDLAPIEKEKEKEEKERQKLIKIYEHNKKIIEKQNVLIAKEYEKQAKLLAEREKIKDNGIKKIEAALFIGGRIASKTYKKMKY